MTDKDKERSTLALSTKLEEDFVGPLTAIRGALEILADHPELNDAERNRFVSTALKSCRHLEQAVSELADSVYDAAKAGGIASGGGADRPDGPETPGAYAERITLHDDTDIMELDFSELVFDSPETVNAVFDAVEDQVRTSAKRWYFIINFEHCRIWPEAWIAYAHRGKKLRIQGSHAVVRYASDETTGSNSADEARVATREAAFELIAEMKTAT
ncbi:hypothetical protein ACKTEK_12775 [Tepidamorphus sp. 3E244]|uniref:hypothetical protein n=1 Tax=Tepidamorphus sp. 3E244 TaxID=3385498 RepID=UPI0038FC3DE7